MTRITNKKKSYGEMRHGYLYNFYIGAKVI